MEITSCQCRTLDDLAVIDMGDHHDVFRNLRQVAERDGRWWWLYASQCEVCGQTWLIAQEERQNDVFILRRLDPTTATRLIHNNEWPTEFDLYESLLEIGRRAGRKVHFYDPVESSLRYTVEDLARERPGIRVSELAKLLNLEPAVAEHVARAVSAATGAAIDFENANRGQ